jgi:DNA-binding GntR family transcriptional regulator
MERILRENTRPGAIINELNLARQFGVAPTGIRECLNRLEDRNCRVPRMSAIRRTPSVRRTNREGDAETLTASIAPVA